MPRDRKSLSCMKFINLPSTSHIPQTWLNILFLLRTEGEQKIGQLKFNRWHQFRFSNCAFFCLRFTHYRTVMLT